MWQIATGQEYRAALTMTNARAPDAVHNSRTSLAWGRGSDVELARDAQREPIQPVLE